MYLSNFWQRIVSKLVRHEPFHNENIKMRCLVYLTLTKTSTNQFALIRNLITMPVLASHLLSGQYIVVNIWTTPKSNVYCYKSKSARPLKELLTVLASYAMRSYILRLISKLVCCVGNVATSSQFRGITLHITDRPQTFVRIQKQTSLTAHFVHCGLQRATLKFKRLQP